MASTMTQNDLENTLSRLGWSKAKLSRRIGVNPNTVCRWEVVPVVVERYLDLVERVQCLWEELK